MPSKFNSAKRPAFSLKDLWSDSGLETNTDLAISERVLSVSISISAPEEVGELRGHLPSYDAAQFGL